MFLWSEFELLGRVIYPEGCILISVKAALIWNHHTRQLRFQVNHCAKYYATYP